LMPLNSYSNCLFFLSSSTSLIHPINVHLHLLLSFYPSSNSNFDMHSIVLNSSWLWISTHSFFFYYHALISDSISHQKVSSLILSSYHHCSCSFSLQYYFIVLDLH
jgi:hypothetical protein